jgi:hypothetical protein
MKAKIIAATLAFAATLAVGMYPKTMTYEAPKYETKESMVVEKTATATPMVWNKKTIENEIALIAEEHKVSSAVMKTVVECESQFNRFALGDGGKSRGLVQIHKGYHPQVTDAMAYDPEYALEFLAKKLAQGKGHLWTCYRMHYN